MPTRSQIRERIDQAHRVRMIIPSGRKLNSDDAISFYQGVALVNAWQLVIDNWRPERLNVAIRHWSIMSRAKHEAIQMFTLAARAAGCPVATGKRAVHLKIEGFRIVADGDAFQKVVLDALVRSGLLVDDNADGLLGQMGFEGIKGRGWRTTLMIGDVA